MSIYKRVIRDKRQTQLIVYLIMLLIGLPTAAHADDLAKGQSLYMIHCSGCHGEKGISLNPEAPNFARGEGLFQPDGDIVDVVRSGINSMPPFLGILQDREILDVIIYARTLQW